MNIKGMLTPTIIKFRILGTSQFSRSSRLFGKDSRIRGVIKFIPWGIEDWKKIRDLEERGRGIPRAIYKSRLVLTKPDAIARYPHKIRKMKERKGKGKKKERKRKEKWKIKKGKGEYCLAIMDFLKSCWIWQTHFKMCRENNSHCPKFNMKEEKPSQWQCRHISYII